MNTVTSPHLVLTDYFGGDVDRVEAVAPDAVISALSVAADRAHQSTTVLAADRFDGGLRVTSGPEELVGATVTWDENVGIVSLSVDVPWDTHGDPSRRSLAAAVFTTELSARLNAASNN